ncbi:putative cysteine-rich receptor-like protein kinase 7-like [Capsicum annuum]|nr:putative cysteine-rich receptor-like protein kinase 7-like [Capsicum annuum]KAF3658544.1 putative cysteine-rich receptor-like protein kinase 7-like [Capsicum annuum]
MTSILVCLLVLSNILVNVKPTEISPLANDCTSSTSSYIEGSKFPLNLNDLLYRSLYNSGGNSIYGKVSVEEDTDKVHGVYLCRGVIAPKDCKKYCIDVASERILRECPHSKQAIIWYDECLVRYSNVLFAYRSLFPSTRLSVPHECKVVLESCNLSYQFRSPDGQNESTTAITHTGGQRPRLEKNLLIEKLANSGLQREWNPNQALVRVFPYLKIQKPKTQ